MDCYFKPISTNKYINIHLYLVLPIIIGIIGLLTVKDREQIGPFTLDHLAWLMGSFILVLGFIIQKFSARYLIGDRNYRKYFPLFTLITSFASVAWLSGDLRLMVLFWATLLSLTLLIRVNRSWKIPHEAAKISGKSFALGWFALLVAVVLLFVSTGDWHINIASSYDNTINSGMKFIIDILIVIAVIVPALNFRFKAG